ncbi:hypothetical protein C8F04DRAFT_1254428 [Mycena alexandri]|uniref:Uncharacterized protein n=1 Tax=Mycena alexandri TaxID=1745969 RepID=A0AAD6X9L5_9AGAR|nr:hypothetical protein C8F04DRAFT_1254428 [Mycena alexandri]
MDRRKSVPRKKVKPAQTKHVVDERPDGWLWQLGRLSKMTDAEMVEWSNEGDRVQWFRAEAEMQRWQEQTEQNNSRSLAHETHARIVCAKSNGHGGTPNTL